MDGTYSYGFRAVGYPLRLYSGKDALEELFSSVGMPVRLSELDIPRASLPEIVGHSLKNFNADPKREFVRERDLLLEVIESAW